uniref:TIR domain-containing protein n=1 Tax=Biomphalaria glabrata TaxID=6526 RepID=A0A2C9K7J9_BIOGL
MLSFNDARELENTTECLWTLCFDKSARQVIKDFPGLVAALDSLKNSDNEKIRKNAKGALWLINEEKEASKVTDNVREDVGQHIFISYSWAEKTKVKEIYKSLKSHGFKVWVDWENMGGSTLQAMAEAVENASVVLICVSENYKLSNNCRLEAEYTFTKKRNYLPLVMQKQYKADGWLGIMLGSKLYYDFSGKYPYEQSEQQLLKALRELEITRPTLEPMPASKESQSTVSCYKMTNAEVVEWLEKKSLQRLSSLLYNIDGKMLWDMKLFSETAPEYFFKEIKDQYELSLVEVIQFNSALKTLH